jgi:hypothetical protein
VAQVRVCWVVLDRLATVLEPTPLDHTAVGLQPHPASNLPVIPHFLIGGSLEDVLCPSSNTFNCSGHGSCSPKCDLRGRCDLVCSCSEGYFGAACGVNEELAAIQQSSRTAALARAEDLIALVGLIVLASHLSCYLCIIICRRAIPDHFDDS